MMEAGEWLNPSHKATRVELARMKAPDRTRELARQGLTIATGSIKNHTVVQKRRKVDRQNRKRGRQ